MRVAYIVTAYTELVQLERLCAALGREDPTAIVLVQFDVGSRLAAPESSGIQVRLTREPIYWGDGSYAREIIESLRVLSEQAWDWVVVISGQDYPVRPLSALHERLEHGEYVAYSPVSGSSHRSGPYSKELVQRYMYHYTWPGWTLPRPLRAVVRRFGGPLERLTAGRFRIQPRPRGASPGLGFRQRTTIFSAERPCWMGSDYTAASRSVVEDMLKMLDREPEILEYFGSTFIPSEALFASIYRWIDRARVSTEGLHFMRFAGRSNPRNLTIEDLPELWDLGHVFARKFTDDDVWAEGLLPMHEPPA